MKTKDFEAKLRRLEIFHDLRVPDEAYPIVRVDGRSFHTVTAGMNKPFDESFHENMIHVARQLLQDLGGSYAYTESDEVSVLLPFSTEIFDRSWEKLVSVSAGIATAAFYQHRGAHFDSRLVVATTNEQVVDYFRWRQADAYRCAVNSITYWTLRQKGGKSARQAHSMTNGMSNGQKHDMLHEYYGTNINDLPVWQRRGSGVYWEEYTKFGVNPQTRAEEATLRRKVAVCENLPCGDEYSRFLEHFI